MEQNKSRWVHIDLIESRAMIFVLIYHANTYTCDILEQASALNYIRYFLKTILSTAVPMFLFANGYLLFNRELKLKKHITKSIKLILLTILWGG